MSYTDRDEIEQIILDDALQLVDYGYNARGWLNSINEGNSSSSAPNDLFGERLYYYGHPSYGAWDKYYNGNIMSQQLSVTDSDTLYQYIYDDLDRLEESNRWNTFLEEEQAFESFTYDDNGNRMSYRLGLAQDSTISHYISGTNLLDSLSGGIDNEFTWDDNGNLSRDDSKNADFGYDIYSQQDTVTFPKSGLDNYIAYGYNVFGERVWKKYYKFWRELCDPGGAMVVRS